MSFPKLYMCNLHYPKYLLNSVKLYRFISATLLITIGHQNFFFKNPYRSITARYDLEIVHGAIVMA